MMTKDSTTKVITFPPVQEEKAERYETIVGIDINYILRNPFLLLIYLPVLPLLAVAQVLQAMQNYNVQSYPFSLPLPYKYIVRRIEVIRDEEGRIVKIIDTIESI